MMEGDRAGHHVWIRQIDEYRRTTRTGITLTFVEPLAMRLSITASAASRGQAHWLWLGFSGLFFAAGIGGAIATMHPGPLVVCLGGALVLWGWLAARRSIAQREAKRVLLGDPDLDRVLHVETDDRDFAIPLLSGSRTRRILSDLAVGDRDFVVTDRRISLNINELVVTADEFEKDLVLMIELAEALHQ